MAIVRKSRLAQSRFHDSRPFFLLSQQNSRFYSACWAFIVIVNEKRWWWWHQRWSMSVKKWNLEWLVDAEFYYDRALLIVLRADITGWLELQDMKVEIVPASPSAWLSSIHLSLSPTSPSILIDIKLLARIYLRHEQRVCSQSQSLSLLLAW